jgi:hypothetical protein
MVGGRRGGKGFWGRKRMMPNAEDEKRAHPDKYFIPPFLPTIVVSIESVRFVESDRFV